MFLGLICNNFMSKTKHQALIRKIAHMQTLDSNKTSKIKCLSKFILLCVVIPLTSLVTLINIYLLLILLYQKPFWVPWVCLRCRPYLTTSRTKVIYFFKRVMYIVSLRWLALERRLLNAYVFIEVEIIVLM